MESAITRDELVHFAQQLVLIALFAGAMGAMLWGALCSVLGALAEALHNREQRAMRIAAARARAASGYGAAPHVEPVTRDIPPARRVDAPSAPAPVPPWLDPLPVVSRRAHKQGDSARGAASNLPPSSYVADKPVFAAGAGASAGGTR